VASESSAVGDTAGFSGSAVWIGSGESGAAVSEPLQ
jgi:hypothetical protein